MKVLILILIFIMSASALAECKNLNLYELPDSPLSKIPVYDQDGSGTCYAYSASQLMNYYLIKNKYASSVAIHPMWVAITYASKKSKTSTVGGNVLEAIKSVKSQAYCEYNSVTKAIQQLAVSNKLSEALVLAFLENYIKNVEDLRLKSFLEKSPKIGDFSKKYYSMLSEAKNINIEAFKKTQEDMKSKCDPSEFANLKSMVIKDLFADVSSISFDIIFSECDLSNLKKIPSKAMEYDKINNTIVLSNQQIESYLNKGLDNEAPLSISYCSGLLSNPSGRFLDTKKPRNKSFKKGCGNHASLVVGSRKLQNSCQYMIKNTWGSGYWTKNATCYCMDKKSKQKSDNCTAKTHPASKFTVLGCWLNADDLTPNIYDAVRIK